MNTPGPGFGNRLVAAMMFLWVTMCWAQPTGSVENETSFFVEAPGGHYDRHKIKIPANATGVTITLVVVENYENEQWGAATSFGLARSGTDDPELFARLAFDEKDKRHEVRRIVAQRRDDVATPASVKPGSTVVWEATWEGGRVRLRLNGQDVMRDVPNMPTGVVVLAVSGMKIRVDDVSFAMKEVAR